MKRITSFLLSVVLIFAQMTMSISISAADAVTVNIDKVSAQTNSTVEVIVSLSNADEVKSIGLNNFKYDKTALTLENAEVLASGAILSKWDSNKEALAIAYEQNSNCNGNILKLIFRTNENSGKKDISCDAVVKKMVGDTETDIAVTIVKGEIDIIAKTPQNITVGNITEKTYGDANFALTVNDNNSELGALAFSSSNDEVATIDAAGEITIKNAGTAVITVSRAGNEEYADFKNQQTLTVKKREITVKADNKAKKIGNADPEFTYQVTGELVDGDTIKGELTRESGEETGKYDILIGTLAINDNYHINYIKGTLEIAEKTPQLISVSEIGEKVYGDASFVVTATPDPVAQLSNFTFESSNTDVASVNENGEVTIKSAGETEITVKAEGNEEFADFSSTQKLIVNAKEVVVISMSVDNKTAVIDGILDADKESVLADFSNVKVEIVSVNDETGVAVVKISDLALAGEKSANYLLAQPEAETEMTAENIVEVKVSAQNGSVVGAGKYLKGNTVTVEAQANNGYTFSGWYSAGTVVSSDLKYTFVADTDTELEARFKAQSSGGGGGGSTASSIYIVRFETGGGTEIAYQKIARGKKISKPEDPKREGYSFDGWYSDNRFMVKFDFETKVTRNLTVYAKWNSANSESSSVGYDETGWYNPFVDIKNTDWYYDSVRYAVNNSLFGGITESKFAPNTEITRAMLVTVLYRYENKPSVGGQSKFSDIPENAYYADAVMWAEQNDIVKGISENEFDPDANITREQIATIMHRFAKFKGYSVENENNEFNYSDATNISDYAVDAMKWADAVKLIQGKSDDTINPKDSATRAEVATIIKRFIENIK